MKKAIWILVVSAIWVAVPCFMPWSGDAQSVNTGSAISGLTTGTVPQAASATSLADSPLTTLNGGTTGTGAYANLQYQNTRNMAITAAVAGSPTVLTVAVAPPNVGGQFVYITGFTGAWAAVNGARASTFVSSTSFSVAVDSTAFGAVTGTPIVNAFTQFVVKSSAANEQANNNPWSQVWQDSSGNFAAGITTNSSKSFGIVGHLDFTPTASGLGGAVFINGAGLNRLDYTAANVTDTSDRGGHTFLSNTAITSGTGSAMFFGDPDNTPPQSGFVSTSGTAVWNGIQTRYNINQTGGANGITRGLYLNNTLTAAADYRGIEMTNVGSTQTAIKTGTGKIVFGGDLSTPQYKTATNCQSSGGTCTAAPAGMVSIAAGATTVTVATTIVTANSEIFIQEDSTLGTALSVTCNTTISRTYAVTTRTAGTSFVITSSAAPSVNPACLSYHIIN
jgi:hypothetical protein